MAPRQRHQTATSPIYIIQSPAAIAAERNTRRYWNLLLVLIASTAIVSSALFTWHQRTELVKLQLQVHHQQQPQQHVREKLTAEELSAQPPNPPPEPLKFISVVGLYHSGTTAMWNSIRSNEHVAAKKGIDLKAYGMSDSSGYPPCGVPLLSDSSVDMDVAMGNSSGIDEQNTHLFLQYGTMWGDWTKNAPSKLKGVLEMEPPHKLDVFYTWWKHTPPQHPMLACSRPDTLYVVMVRHPKVWKQSMQRILYGLKFDSQLNLWSLVRSDPRRLPPMKLYFRSLYNIWEYYMRGYLAWEDVSGGMNCYASSQAGDSDERKNCLGGTNKIPDGRRNILIVRYEDYLMEPKRILAQIFSFATRGLINAETEEDKFVPYNTGKLQKTKAILTHLKDRKFFSAQEKEWEGATKLTGLCTLLGYSCDELPELLVQ